MAKHCKTLSNTSWLYCGKIQISFLGSKIHSCSPFRSTANNPITSCRMNESGDDNRPLPEGYKIPKRIAPHDGSPSISSSALVATVVTDDTASSSSLSSSTDPSIHNLLMKTPVKPIKSEYLNLICVCCCSGLFYL